MMSDRVYSQSQEYMPAWRDVRQDLADGSWALVLAGILMFLALRKPLVGYISAQIEVLNALKEDIDSNRDSIGSIADSHKSLEVKLVALEHNQKRQLELLEDIRNSLEAMD